MLYIVTPVFNRLKFTAAYLKALSVQTCNNFKIIIVDDGSNDGTSDMIRDEYPEVELLEKEGDLWWAEATNIGVHLAIDLGATYIMTLNDDTLPAPDFIEKTLHWSNQFPNVLLGCLAINAENDEPVFAGEILSWTSDISVNALKSVPKDKRYGLHEINLFPGRGLLIPIEVFDKIGFYDSKNFPQTIADLDFAIRATEYGYKMYCNYDAKLKIYPNESGSVSLIKTKSLKNYYDHLFGIRGGGNLKWFTIFTFKNAPKKYVLQYWFKGMARRIGGYLILWIKGS